MHHGHGECDAPELNPAELMERFDHEAGVEDGAREAAEAGVLAGLADAAGVLAVAVAGTRCGVRDAAGRGGVPE